MPKNGIKHLVLLVALYVPLCAQAQHEDPLVGTWVMDIANSEWDPAFPVLYREFTVNITTNDVGYRLESDVVFADGRQVHSSNLWRYDGGETPWRSTSGSGVTAQFQRLNTSTYQFVLRTNGIIRLISRGTVASDGRSRRHVVIGFNADGLPFRNIEVYRKKSNTPPP